MGRLLALVAAVALAALCVPALADVSGSVVDANGKGIAAAKVWVIEYTDQGARTSIVYTDRDGKFSATCGDRTRLVAAAPGYTWGQSNRPEEHRIVLYPERKVRGKVVDENGGPVAGATVRMSSLWAGTDFGASYNIELPPDSDLGRLTTAADGSFALLHLPDPAGFNYISCNLTVEAPGRALLHTSAGVEELSKELVLTDPLGCRLQGKLYLPGRSAAAPENTNLQVQLLRKEGRWETRSASTGADGTFVFEKLPPGKVNVMLAGFGGRMTEQGWEPIVQDWALVCVMNVELSPAEPRTLDLELTSGALIAGKVVVKKDGTPIKNARLSVTHAGRPRGTPPSDAMTDEDGRFSLRVAEGAATVAVRQFQHEGRYVYYQDEQQPSVTLASSESAEASDVLLEVDPSANISGGSWAATQNPVPADFEFRPGTYNLTWDPEIDCSSLSERISTALEGDKARQLIAKLPNLASTKAIYRAFPLDGPPETGYLCVAMDESGSTGKGFDTLYLDANRNRDLTDDTPIKFSALAGNYQSYASDWIQMQMFQGSGDSRSSNPGAVRLRLYRYSDDDFRLTLGRRGAWRGTVDANKGSIQCLSVDGNADGIYGELTKPGPAPVDFVIADTNGYGSAIVSSYGSQAVPLCEINRVASKYYTIKVSPDGSRLTIAPYDGPMGKLLVRASVGGVDAPATSAYIGGAKGYFQTQLDGSPIDTPVDTYYVYYCDFAIPGKDGKSLPLSCSIKDPIAVDEGKLAEIVVGGELTLAVNPDKKRMSMLPGKSVVNWVVNIGSGVTVNSLGDQSKEQTPQINFYDTRGKLLKTTTAGYT